MKTVYAILWTMTATQEAFDAAVPRLMEWLQTLKSSGQLKACGGFANVDGGLTMIEAQDLAEATRIAERSPQAALGTSRVFEWEVFDAELRETSHLR
jgi:uncharacterized protein YciI